MAEQIESVNYLSGIELSVPLNLNIKSTDSSKVSKSSLTTTDNVTSDNEQPIIAEEPELSSKRWMILFSMVCLAFLLGLSDQLTPILNVLCELLELEVGTYVLINQLSSNPWFVISFLTAWLIDRFGIKFGVRLAVFLTVIQNCVRALLLQPTWPLWRELRMVYYVATCSLNMIVLVVYFCLPLKISETWFPDNERSFAWVSMMCAFELGLTISSWMVPRLVTNKTTAYKYADVNLVSAAILIIVTLFCVNKSKPPQPPSARALRSSQRKTEYLAGLKIMASNNDFRLHIMYMSAGIAAKIALLPYLQDILAAYGYDNQFCGTLLSIQTGVGIVALLVSSPFVPHITNITLGCKLFASLSLVSFIVFIYTLQLRDSPYLIIGATVVNQALSSWGSPIYQNMCAHLSNGIIGEASISPFISTGIVVMGGIVTLISVNLRQTNGFVVDYSASLIFTGLSMAIPTIIYVAYFRGTPPDSMSANIAETTNQQQQRDVQKNSTPDDDTRATQHKQ